MAGRSTEAPPRSMKRELRSESDGRVGVGDRKRPPKGSGRPRLEPAEDSLELPLTGLVPGSIVENAVFTVSAGIAGASPLASVAVVRPGAAPSDGDDDKNTSIVDFQRMRTVSEIAITQPSGETLEIHDLRPWLGTQFADATHRIGSGADTSFSFPEVQTERLLVISDATAEELAERGTVVLPSPPADLEIVLGTTRLWSKAGPVRAAADAPFSIDVNLTREVQAAIDAAAPGDFPLTLMLSAGTPGDLGFAVKSLVVSRVYQVPLPDQGGKSLVFETEGRQTLALPLASDGASWNVSHVRATVDAKIAATRVLPPEGPPLTEDAELLLDAEHAIAVRLPASQLAAFDTLSAVRVPVFVDSGSAELVGMLRDDRGDQGPGDPSSGASFGPITVEAAPRAGGPQWITLTSPAARKLQPGVTLWLVLAVARGKLSLLVTVPTSAPEHALWHGLPSGAFHPLPAIPDFAPAGLEGALRLVGVSATDAAIAALQVWVSGSSEGAEFTPTSDGVAMDLDVTARPPGAELPLLVVATTAGSYRFREVEVVYR
jgi:hypothetical protein